MKILHLHVHLSFPIHRIPQGRVMPQFHSLSAGPNSSLHPLCALPAAPPLHFAGELTCILVDLALSSSLSIHSLSQCPSPSTAPHCSFSVIGPHAAAWADSTVISKVLSSTSLTSLGLPPEHSHPKPIQSSLYCHFYFVLVLWLLNDR